MQGEQPMAKPKFEYVCTKHDGFEVHFNGTNCTCCPVCIATSNIGEVLDGPSVEDLKIEIGELHAEINSLKDELNAQTN
jgi:hypothetical protein